MGLPFVLANVTELDTPQLDANFNALGVGLVIPCTAVGTNAITLTPIANMPTISAYSNNAPVFGFQAVANTTTSPVTLQVGGLAALNVYKSNGATVIGANDFLIGLTYYVAFNQALNSNAGGWVLVNPGASAATAGAVQSAFKNLVAQNGGTPNTQVTMTADAVAVSDGATNFTTLLLVNVTVNSGSVGANGLDTGSLAASTWYAFYIIYNPTTLTVAGLMSTSFTTPTLPSGFTQFSRLSSQRTDGSKNFLRITQKGRRAQYIITASTNTATIPIIASGTQGTFSATTPTWATPSVSTFVPPTATEIFILASNFWKGSGAAQFTLAPSSQYHGSENSDGSIGWGDSTLSAGLSQIIVGVISMMLEATTIAVSSSAAGGAFGAGGWIDNI